mmetsp:Transcript_32761/g.75428  ORF Transcript_32761/g.75428 Transcript_32761/m.75428 type:complete len:129 (-) Transcript_32761:187-573(-)
MHGKSSPNTNKKKKLLCRTEGRQDFYIGGDDDKDHFSSVKCLTQRQKAGRRKPNALVPPLCLSTTLLLSLEGEIGSQNILLWWSCLIHNNKNRQVYEEEIDVVLQWETTRLLLFVAMMGASHASQKKC